MRKLQTRPSQTPPNRSQRTPRATAQTPVSRAIAGTGLPDPPITIAAPDTEPTALMAAIQRVIDARALSPPIELRAPAVLARLPIGPQIKSPDNTVANWCAYFDELEPQLVAFEKTALPVDLALASATPMVEVRSELGKVVRALAAFNGNLYRDAATWTGLQAQWIRLRALADAVKSYSEADQVRLAGPPVVPPKVALTTVEDGWVADIARDALAIGIGATDAAAIAASVKGVRAQDEISTEFLGLIARVFGELSGGSDRFESVSLAAHLCKLKTDKEGFTGIIAEVQAALMLLKQGVVDPTVEIKMGQDVTRPAPYMAATAKQDIDLVYVDTISGEPTLVEVKDAVITLEKKMNANAGGKYTAPSVAGPTASKHEHHYDPMQVSSLASARDAVAATTGAAALRVICVRPRGWVRFMLSRHSLTLAKNNVTLQIGTVEFRPSQIRAFREYLEGEMDTSAPGWRGRQREDPTTAAGGAAPSRDQAMWDYEAQPANAWGTHLFTS